MPVKSETISHEGDLILIPGTPSTGIKVSAATLIQKSAVFAGMLIGRFAEGQATRSPTSPQEVNLPEDDYINVLHLCPLLHEPELILKITRIDNPAWPQQFSDLGKIVDKYQFADALAAQTAGMLRWQVDQLQGRLDRDLFLVLSTAAYLWRQPAYFHAFTKVSVLNVTLPYLWHEEDEDDGHDVMDLMMDDELGMQVGIQVISWLEFHWESAMKYMSEALTEMATVTCGNPKCVATAESAEFLDTVAQRVSVRLKQHLPRSPETPVCEILTEIEALGSVSASVPLPCGHSSRMWRTAAEFAVITSRVRDRMAGLCLHCTKAGRYSCGMSLNGHFRPGEYGMGDL